MRRREFIALVGTAAAAWPIGIRAQEPNLMRRVGVLLIVNDEAERQTRYSAFRHTLEELGWSDGRNLSLITRWPADPAKIRADAAELVALKPDVIFAAPSPALPPLHEETTTIPIVFAQVFDPVALGLVKTLARPDGNITGFMVYEAEIAQKWVELLKQLAPTTERVAILQDLINPGAQKYLSAMEASARSLGLQVHVYKVSDAADIVSAFEAFGHQPNVGLAMTPGQFMITNHELVVSLTMKYRVPSVYTFRYYVESGGLASYGADYIDEYKQAASYVDRILRGAKPADLPVQQPTKFEFVINMKTAKALGLSIPSSVQLLADKVIE